ncbi:efflux RND transporter periplasmic adaptor subunit [Dongia sedimenti]|uniref:Efflux RND transporter periplasmic adaptor subunit n=1 Tax=Dongia sedimenti TaxID=3064282 RepID=A0ABU0YTT3_9PROT|nr:efflux RND transporter periplasmic adaptor subunit [Rhodospirillaceae bacterium R-7]
MRPLHIAVLAAFALAFSFAGRAFAADTFTVAPVTLTDEKAVFATVESVNVVPARARIAGTIAELTVRQGDRVERGQVIGTVGDEKLVLQLRSLDAQIAGLKAQLAQANIDLDRAQRIFKTGAIPKQQLDQAQTNVDVASNSLKAQTGQRAVVEQQLTEGQVLAPSSGRVLTVPVIAGTVVMSGEPLATIAEQDFVLRIRVPERHARFLKVGDPIRLDGEAAGLAESDQGTITLVYPRIEDGRVVADAKVQGLSDYFVGERVRVWVSGGERRSFVVPAAFVTTRFGTDYVTLRLADGKTIDAPVQRGRDAALADIPEGIEILSGIAAGDVLVRP